MAKFKTGIATWGFNSEHRELCIRQGAHFPDIESYDIVQLTELSIEKWEYVIKRLKETKEYIADGGTSTCALCMRYKRADCHGCPIREVTGYSGCEDSPYTAYETSSRVKEDLDIAKEELAFLKGRVLKKAKEMYGSND